MKKDITIPEVDGVYVAIVNEFNETYNCYDWNSYIINTKQEDLEMVLIVSKGFNEDVSTSIMRHSIKKLPSKSFAKIELLQDDVLKLNNEFKISFFENNVMFYKNYLFRKNAINKKALQSIPLMNVKGVLVK